VAVFGPIKSERKLRRFGVLDLEWVPGEVLPMPERTELRFDGIREPLVVNLPPAKTRTAPLELRLAGYYDQRPVSEDDCGEEALMEPRYEVFKTVADLIDFMFVREHRGMWFYAHAGGLADMEFVLDELLQQIKDQLVEGRRTQVVFDAEGNRREEVVRGSTAGSPAAWTIKASFSGSSAILVHVTRGKNTWHCVDSYWLFRDKLSKIGESIGIKKVDEDKRRTPEETRRYYADTPLSELIPYNKVDCEILWKAVAEFEREVLSMGGQLQQTIASTAMNLFRRSYMRKTIYTSEAANQVAVKSYFASRVEVFERDVEDFNIYDINSSFPYSMTFPLPANLVAMSTDLPSEDSDSCLYVADVTVEVPEMEVPPLPFRTPDDSRVFFPTGRWRSWFTSTDVRLAVREGCKIHAVHECYQYEPFDDFSRYATEIYALRSASTTPFRKLLLKYLLNSLYGKAAESVVKQEMLINPLEEELDRSLLQLLQPGVWLREKEVPIVHRHVVVSSIITALSRRHLYDYAKMCTQQKKPIYYCDSITGDRTVILRSPEGRIVVDPVAEVWEARGKDLSSYKDDKETCVLGEGWQALARDGSGREGWFPLRRLIRHKTEKVLYLISSKRGQVRVTQDHSLVVGDEEVKPDDFIARNLQFDTVRAPAPVVLESIDLFEYVRDFERTSSGSVFHGGSVSNYFELGAGGEWIDFVNFRKKRQSIRRYYRRGSGDLHRLLRVLAAFIAEGSSSLRGVTTTTRDMFSLCQDEEAWLLGLRDDLLAITKDVELTGPKWSEGSQVFYLRSGAGMLPCLFGTLGGIEGSQGRKLPSFVYELSEDDFLVFWKKIVEGDGTVDDAGNAAYTTSSQRLVAGLSYLLDQHRLCHSIHYRPSKGSYAIRLRPAGSERRRWTTLVEKSVVDDYVYDLEVEGAHTFVDGVGRILLHNTDSIASKADLPVDEKKLGALKLEKRMSWAEFVAPKIYRGEGEELKGGLWKAVRLARAKGFSLSKFEDQLEVLGRIMGGEQVGVQTMVRMRELFKSITDGGVDGGHLVRPGSEEAARGGSRHEKVVSQTAPYEQLVVKALTQRMLSKRYQYPDGKTRAWTVAEILSGDFQARGFDFSREFLDTLDTTTRAMLASAV
jgi:hypothetical protein